MGCDAVGGALDGTVEQIGQRDLPGRSGGDLAYCLTLPDHTVQDAAVSGLTGNSFSKRQVGTSRSTSPPHRLYFD